MFEMLMKKLMKSEFLVAMIAMVASALAPKLGVPPESLETFLMSINGLASAYVLGRSYAKPRELV